MELFNYNEKNIINKYKKINLLDNLNELDIFINYFNKIKKYNRENYAEVFTPLDLIEELLDK